MIMKILFRINYVTEWGQDMWISGSNEVLGNWDESKAVPMTYVGNGNWESEINFPEEQGFEYKYFVRQNVHEIIWEGGKNRSFLPVGFPFVVINDNWQVQIDEESVLFTKLFTQVLFKREGTSPIKNKAKPFNRVRFRVSVPRINANQVVGLVGNNKALGIWAKPLQMSDENFPFWSVDVDFKEYHLPIHYKYVIIDKKTGETVIWEEGEERTLIFDNTEGELVLNIQNDQHFRFPTGNWKGAGVAVPVFSLRSDEGFGTGEFNDLKKLSVWARETGLKVIQVLPINETIATHSWLDSYPYKAISVFALHPIYLNLDLMGKLDDEKLLDEFEMVKNILNSNAEVDYVEVMRAKSRYYKLIFDQTWNDVRESAQYKAFFKANSYWLEDYAAFCFLRDRYKTADFRQWDEWAVYDAKKVKKLVDPRAKHFEHIAVHYFIQYHLDKQLQDAIDFGHKQGIAFKGDIPIGISPNSVEAWTQPTLFNLNGQAGAPPDGFAVLGQNWGFPTYNWEVMEKDNFQWWKKRLTALSKYFDAYRIDHILGFFRIWEIPQQAMHGLLGYFRPGLPMGIDEIQNWGIVFDEKRFTKPYIKDHFLNEIFGEYTDEVKSKYLVRKKENYSILPDFDTQKKVYNHFSPDQKSEENISEKDAVIRDGLISLLDEVLFIRDPYCASEAYHPRISMHYSYSYADLDPHTKMKINELYIDFFYHRHEDFWKELAYRKLPSLLESSDMLVCGEDLGMVPDCVIEVMKNLNILSLEIQRMPKNPDIEFAHPADAPYLSVCTTSTHDMSTIRGWWEENRENTQRFYNHVLGHLGDAPYFAEPWICNEIIQQHMYSPAMLTIFPIQDLLAIDGVLRWSETHRERINVPSDEKNKWRYRMILPLEELLKDEEFTNTLKSMINVSGRDGK
jgi:4-alpha-glucanotransferase